MARRGRPLLTFEGNVTASSCGPKPYWHVATLSTRSSAPNLDTAARGPSCGQRVGRGRRWRPQHVSIVGELSRRAPLANGPNTAQHPHARFVLRHLDGHGVWLGEWNTMVWHEASTKGACRFIGGIGSHRQSIAKRDTMHTHLLFPSI
jgi:hypothetical protein